MPDSQLRDCFLRDTLALAGRLPNAHPLVIGADDVHEALEAALADGPAVLITADVPHLPIWRLRDAFTHLCAGADLVVGPAERGGWYLLGLGAGSQQLLSGLAGPSGELAIAERHGEAVVTLPAWYRLRSPDDLTRLAADLAPMPADVASCTRALLCDDGLQAREVGG